MKEPDVSRLQEWLNLKTARGAGERYTLRTFSAHVAWETLTWARWTLRRGPKCGDHYCWETAHWPHGIVAWRPEEHSVTFR